MKKSSILLLLASSVSLAFAATPPKEGVLYYNSFDKSLTADYAAGQAAPLKADGAKIVPGGRSGKAYMQDAPGSLKIASKGNINPTAGTIAMWVKPVNWNGNDGKFHTLFSVGPVRHGRRTFQVYKYFNAHFMFLARNPEVNNTITIYETKHFIRWQPGEWHHVALSWSKADKQCILYVDGEPSIATYNEEIMPRTINDILEGASFNAVADAPHWDKNHRTLIDELYIFDRPIGNRGVAELMEVGLKSDTPRFTIPRITKSPQINGVIDPGEYDEFFSTNTFVETGKAGFYARETQVYTGYDDKNLYVMFKSRTKGGDQNIEILAQRNNRDDQIWLDDAVELVITDSKRKNTLHFVINSIGTIYDALNGKAAFNGNYETANLIEGIWWVCELKMPFSELGITPPTPGESWLIHMTRDWKNPFVFTSLSDTADFHDKNATPVWTFDTGKGTGTIHMDMEKIQSQQADLKISATESPLEAILFTRDRAGKEAVLEKTSVAPGKTGSIFLDINRVDVTKYQNKLGFKLIRNDGVILQKSEYAMRTYPPMELNASLLTLSNSFKYNIDFSGLAAPLNDIMLDCVYSENGKTVKAWQEKSPAGRVISGIIKPGIYDHSQKYAIKVTAKSKKSGSVLVEKILNFEVPEVEIWQNSKAGINTFVPPPWTPVKRNGFDVSVWDRTYKLQKNGMPAAITGQNNTPLLAVPARLVLKTDAGDLEFAEIQFVETDREDQTAFFTTAENRNFKARIDGVVEFDGFTFYDCVITPKNASATLNKAQLTFSVPKSEADFAQISTFGTGYASLYKQSDIPKKMEFVFQILLGNDHRALAFFMDCPESFHPELSKHAVTTSVDSKNVNVSVNFASSPYKPGKEVRYGFGWQAAPVKPIPDNWRDWIQSYRGKHNKDSKLIQIWSWSYWYGFLRPISEKEWTTNITALKNYYPNASLQPYFCQYILSMVSPEYKLYGEEWTKAPRMELMEFGPRYPGKSVCACLGVESYRNFWMDTLERFLDKYPEINACYWDSIDPGACENELHNCGWRDSKGNIHPTLDIKNYRSFYKRAYRIFKAKHPDGIITGHSSERRNLPTFSFCDVVYDGEQFVSRASADPDYCNHLDDLYCRAFFGSQFGIVPMFFSAYYNNEKIVEKLDHPTETIYLHSLIYGYIVHSHRMNNNITDHVLDITRPFGIGQAEFFPYYDSRTREIAQLETSADIRMSIYRNPQGRLLIVLGNFSGSDASATLTLPANTPAVEKRSGTQLTPDGENKVTVTVKRHNFILIEQ